MHAHARLENTGRTFTQRADERPPHHMVDRLHKELRVAFIPLVQVRSRNVLVDGLGPIRDDGVECLQRARGAGVASKGVVQKHVSKCAKSVEGVWLM